MGADEIGLLKGDGKAPPPDKKGMIISFLTRLS